MDGNECGISNGTDEEDGERKEGKEEEFCIGISEAPFSFYPSILPPPFTICNTRERDKQGRCTKK